MMSVGARVAKPMMSVRARSFWKPGTSTSTSLGTGSRAGRRRCAWRARAGSSCCGRRGSARVDRLEVAVHLDAVADLIVATRRESATTRLVVRLVAGRAGRPCRWPCSARERLAVCRRRPLNRITKGAREGLGRPSSASRWKKTFVYLSGSSVKRGLGYSWASRRRSRGPAGRCGGGRDR